MAQNTDQLQEIERLFTEIREYQKGENFRQLLEFCARFRYLSPYNAWLVQLQMPGAKYTLTEKQWKERYQRQLKKDARPLIVLQPFGPINMVFDIGDTISINDADNQYINSLQVNHILEELAAPFKTKGTISLSIIGRLIQNIKFSGIAVKTADKGTEYGGGISINHEEKIAIELKGGVIHRNSDYVLCISSRAELGEKFATLIHELGHLFCRHLPGPNNAWDLRKLSRNSEEFEAETVSWLICERLGVGNPSEKYLSKFLDGGEIPDDISIHHILLAVNEIEKLISYPPSKAIKAGFLWKFEKGFKEAVKQVSK